jgi:hypothetical protein
MSIWIILSWVFVAILTGINIFIFLKLKKASEDMLKMAFPGAKNMNEALSQMQSMMGQRGPMRGGSQGPFGGGGKSSDAQLKAAMDMLKNAQKKR